MHLKWKLIFKEDNWSWDQRIEIGEYDVPHEGKLAAVAYVGCELTWGVSPEGHIFCEVPYDLNAPAPLSSMMLRNPYYDYWREHTKQEMFA